MSGVRCQVSGVRCQVSGVRCQVSGEYLKSGICHELKFVNKKSITYRQVSLTTWVILAENEIHLGPSSSSRHLAPNLFPDT